jgi:hypothetical protein
MLVGGPPVLVFSYKDPVPYVRREENTGQLCLTYPKSLTLIRVGASCSLESNLERNLSVEASGRLPRNPKTSSGKGHQKAVCFSNGSLESTP